MLQLCLDRSHNLLFYFQFNVGLLRSILSKIDTHHDSVNFLFSYNPWDCSCNKVKAIQVPIPGPN